MLKIIINIASKIHGRFKTNSIDILIELFLKKIFSTKAGAISWNNYAHSFIDSYKDLEENQKFFNNPSRFLKSMAIVMKSPTNDSKGLIAIKYNYAFPTFLALFDIKKILSEYHLLLEPSFSRYLTPEILMYDRFDDNVFVQTNEPRDAVFLQRFSKNLIPIPIASNWWIDEKVFLPSNTIKKDVDIIMIASWAKFKRHDLLFNALGKLKKRGILLKCILAGYRIDLTIDDIWAMAKKEGVQGQLEIYERLDQKQVTLQYQRAKINLLLSRREGCNRAIIEGMLCNVPCMIREGFNYGYRYPYINNATGIYFDIKKLSESLVDFLEEAHTFSPRNWVLNNMTPRHAVSVINRYIYGNDDNTNDEIVMKISALNGMNYWNQEDEAKFHVDYSFLLSCKNNQ